MKTKHLAGDSQENILAYLKTLELFENLPAKEVEHFARAAKVKRYPKGTILHSEDDKAEHFYIICSGWLKLAHATEDGVEVVLSMLTSGSVVGDNSVFEGGRHKNSAQVVEPAELIVLPLAMLQQQLRLNNQLAHNMLNLMVKYQRCYELHLIRYALYSAPQRIGCFLLNLCHPTNQKDGAVLQLPYDKMLIAATLGMRAATFSRALHTLRQETGLHIVGSQVKISSVKRLLDFVGACYSQAYLERK